MPGKNLRELAGRPLIEYAIDAALDARRVTRTVVSTDSEEIARVAVAAGVEVPFMRPAELALDTTAMVDTVAHALEVLTADSRYRPDRVVLLQPTAPLRRATDVDAALERLEASHADTVVSVTGVPLHLNAHWQLEERDGVLHLADGKRLDQVITRRQDLPRTFLRNGAIYAFRLDAFVRTGTFYGDRCVAFEMPAERSVNIDREEDLVEAERVIRSGGLG